MVDQWLGRMLRGANNAMLQHFLKVFEPFDIRPGQFSILATIEQHPHVSGAQLGRMLEIPRANITVVLQELERRNLIQRDTAIRSGRSQAISLTADGMALMQQLHAAHADHVAFFEDRMSPAERQFLCALLTRIWRTEEPACR
ncbi:MAG: hypothetical protein DI544_14405 [Sphingomonas taxi]|uniref:HTH marR-type domain-containing protein n=1 Tax=Sphingomonas taxi TaxID=1549858 RepID=A0A2W5QUA5_9SPHN|nr:MAG: hypothetical protein DI544_14405 [Sphingomonas taxi]